jgi:hypothetical protein
MTNTVAHREMLERLSHKLVDEGRLIEAGWTTLRAIAIPADASEAQLRDMRIAFFAGARHLLGSIMSILDAGEEPSEADLNRMDRINAELEKFIAEMKQRGATRQ